MPNFLECLPKSLQAELSLFGREKQYDTDDTLFQEGAPPKFLPIILSGRVKVVKFLDEGKETIINIFTDGDAFVIPPLVDNLSYPATAIAMERTRMVELERERFLELLKTNPDFSFAIIRELSKLLREKNKVIRELATSSPRHRILVTLERIVEKSGQKAYPIVITLRRREIAEMAGLTTETAIRVIRKLAAESVLKIERAKIIIESPLALTRELKRCAMNVTKS
ncbi:transcriptional regulator, Crp/Fnr family [Chloroherpeton thalassium ATCC 35110]|uniref:Transcriptional regulator, Crp/Fnr family n=1 Tax=Chloroherpeton thalassium (strain ATCC 35110 / GB-78) TaxID=517418 RepID=B3QWU5_CHLT3|nr:Crp/Fnr family transcriptional regulator [Chloroherpeton thalassium]ACF13309.1 transcriptional regulator, Crp/Fnr family [Chloroherpeton thalassium ATCC 35110]